MHNELILSRGWNAIDSHLRALQGAWTACPVFNEEICNVCQEGLSFKTVACLGERLDSVWPWPRNVSQSEEISINHLKIVAFIVSGSGCFSDSSTWISLKIYSLIFYLKSVNTDFHLNVLSFTLCIYLYSGILHVRMLISDLHRKPVGRTFWYCNKEHRTSKQRPRTRSIGPARLHKATYARGLGKTFLARVQTPPPRPGFSSPDGHGTTLWPCGQQEAVFKPGQLWNGP